MRGLKLILCLCVPLLCMQAAAAPPQDARSAFDDFIRAFNALDWDAFRAHLAPTITVFNPDVPGVATLHRIDGREAVEKSFRAVFDASNGRGPGIVPEHVQLEQRGTLAFVSFEFARGGGSFGRRTLIFERQGASWLIVHLHASNVQAAPAH